MKKTFVSLLTAFALLPLTAMAQDPQSPKVAVVPFAALSGDVPQLAGNKAAVMLSNELKGVDKFSLVDVKRAAPLDPYAENLEKARSLVGEAQELRSGRKFRVAEETLKKAIEAFRAGAPGLSDIGELQDAYVLLSAIQYSTGRDDEGAKSLRTALALAPDRELPLAKTSALFTRVVNAARAELKAGAKGTLLVESTPAGAAVTVDGVALGASPLVVKDVPPGLHVWSVQLPSGEKTGGVVEVAASKQAKVAAQSQGTDPESRILMALSQNKLDDAVMKAAKEQAQAVGADLLFFGALSKEGKTLALDYFVLKVASGEVKRLPRSSFDTELLSAGMEFYNLVGKLAKDGLAVGADTRIPGPVSNEFRASNIKVAEASYGVAPNRETKIDIDGVVPADSKGDGKREPVEPKKREPLRRTPLRK
ncbi:MAG: PEGA domain-containing protein [Myxococcaceae bacterium]